MAPYREAAVAATAIFALYVLTLAPTTAFWDASEYIATADTLGIPHPPGSPLFVALARTWIVLLAPLGLSVAVRVNLLAALTSAGASGFFFLFAHRIAWGLMRHRGQALVGAAAAVLIGATAFTVWNQSNVNEKVYTISVLVIAAVTWLAVRWKDNRDDPKSIRLLLIAGYLMILGWSNHTMSLLPLPALGVFVLAVSPGLFLRRDFLVRAVSLVIVGLSFNVFLPIRAAERPVINEGDPVCESPAEVAGAVLSTGRRGCTALASVLTREQYAKPALNERQAPLTSQLLNYFQYFDWQWARGLHPSPVPGNSRLPVTLLFVGLGLLGLWAVWQVDRNTFAYVGDAHGDGHGGSRRLPELRVRLFTGARCNGPDPPRGSRTGLFLHRELHLVGPAGRRGPDGGVETVCRARSGASACPRDLTGPSRRADPVRLQLGMGESGRDYAARDWAYDLLQSVEPYGVLFTAGDNDTFPLWYLQEVEGIRKDVTVIVGEYLATDWYPKQLQELTVPGRQRAFEPDERLADLYPIPALPQRPILSVTPADMDRVVGGRTSRQLNVPVGPVVVAYPEGRFLSRGQLMSLAIMRDSIDERPIYFSSSAGLISSLGLQDYGVQHGLATRLNLSDPAEAPDLVQLGEDFGGGWVDVDRSRRLYDEVFRMRSLKDRDVWSDRASLNIPTYYYFFSLGMADALNRSGASPEEVARFESDAMAFLVTARGGRRAILSGP